MTRLGMTFCGMNVVLSHLRKLLLQTPNLLTPSAKSLQVVRLHFCVFALRQRMNKHSILFSSKRIAWCWPDNSDEVNRETLRACMLCELFGGRLEVSVDHSKGSLKHFLPLRDQLAESVPTLVLVIVLRARVGMAADKPPWLMVLSDEIVEQLILALRLQLLAFQSGIETVGAGLVQFFGAEDDVE